MTKSDQSKTETPRTLSVGLLLCDDVPQDGRERFGNYLGMFERGLESVNADIRLTAYDAYKGVLPGSVSDHDGYLISGSGASVFEDLQWIRDLMEFVRQADVASIDMVGICFGHQLIAHALGGEAVRSDNGWGFGIHGARLDQIPKWMSTDDRNFRLVVIHQDQVETLPPGFSTLASNDFCPNSMISNGRNMLGIQGHPEFDKAYCAYRAAFRRQLIGEACYQQTIDSLENLDTDSRQVFSWINAFFRRSVPQQQSTGASQAA